MQPAQQSEPPRFAQRNYEQSAQQSVTPRI
jgi:hypothetical protein